jgi:uncharacterized protein
MLKRIFVGPHGARAGWLLLLFLAAEEVGNYAVLSAVFSVWKPTREWTPTVLVVVEFTTTAILFALMFVFSRFERRSLADYAFPLREAFRSKFWAGLVWGFVVVGLLFAAIALSGGARMNGFHLHGPALWRNALGWALAMLGIGFSEELLFRAYPLMTLARGIGFWWASIVLTLVFAGMHYFLKPFENWADALSVGLLGLFLCLTVRRTGGVWFAIGFHAAFDYAALALLGAPNSGNGGHPVDTRILDITWGGSHWISGGVLGMEASLLIFPILALLFFAFDRVYRPRPAEGRRGDGVGYAVSA